MTNVLAAILLATAGPGAVTAVVQESDTTLAVAGATRLSVDSQSGVVIVRTWDRPQVRVQAEHSSRTEVVVRRRGAVLEVGAESRRGMFAVADYEITIPRAMDVSIDGMHVTVEIVDADGAVDVENLEGDIVVRGGRGRVRIETTNGQVSVEGARGSIEVDAVSRGIRISNSSGEIRAESVGGPVTLRNITSGNVEATSVGGSIEYDGTIEPGGSYYFASHGGTITIRIPPGVNATVGAASVMGSLSVRYPGAPEARTLRRGRNVFTLGDGSAEIEAETFGGTIVIRERGDDSRRDDRDTGTERDR